MNNRHRAREIALQILYREILPSEPQQLIRELQEHFDHFKIPQELREFSALLVAGALKDANHLDELIRKHSAPHWKLERMTAVDRSLLRIAIYELLNHKETPPSVVIDEAVELAKQFGTEDSPAFINGLLDSIRKTLQT